MLRVSKLVIDGVVAWNTRRGGILAGVRKLVTLELALPQRRYGDPKH
jgi:hypothetical protein